jgi:hypothetical protein
LFLSFLSPFLNPRSALWTLELNSLR